MSGWDAGGRTQIISDNGWRVHRSCPSVLSRGTIRPASYLNEQLQGGRQESFSPQSTPVFEQQGGNDCSIKGTFVFR